mmetsp:Transcript_51016/g.119311  ORF Transcript_51016/g.119311 Transcript_51016/m.119311 type:complete len:1179 (+) Transcript_51016:81-3617(+)
MALLQCASKLNRMLGPLAFVLMVASPGSIGVLTLAEAAREPEKAQTIDPCTHGDHLACAQRARVGAVEEHMEAQRLHKVDMDMRSIQEVRPPFVKGPAAPLDKAMIAKFWAIAVAIFVIVSACVVLARAALLSGNPGKVGSEDSTSFAKRNWGMTLRFNDPSLEEQWRDNVVNQEGLKTGTRTLLCAGTAVILYHFLRMYIAVKETCLMEHMSHDIWKLAIELTAFALSYWCWKRPSFRIYQCLVGFYFFYALAMSIVPFSCSCNVLLSQCSRVGDKSTTSWFVSEMISHYDCSLQGPTATMTVMTWIFTLPWVVMSLEEMHLVWLWLVVVYLSWTALYMSITGETYFRPSDVALRFMALCIALVAALLKKFQIEKPRRLAYLKELEHLSSCKGLFSILEIMMPRHVIMPKLLGNPIADDIDTVSILFIVIDGFEGFAHRLTPTQLLGFLNERFRDMDAICVRNAVTKIETVCDEYVACVGVLPDDVAEGQESGHGLMLERLFTASRQILATQTEEVQYKMGIHTGPIVAGVIGTKLPRYRLFGNTINTAARMMQKGIVGKVQFGIETHAQLLEGLASKVTYRGEVEMKGKGQVQAYLFPQDEQERASVTSASAIEDGGAVGNNSIPAAKPVRRVSVLMRLLPMRKNGRPESQLAPAEGNVQELDAEAEESFQQALRQLTEDSRHYRGWKGFSKQMEKVWTKEYHEDTFCLNLHLRYGEMCMAMLLMFAAEMGYMLRMRAWRYEHDVYGKSLRLPVFVYSRLMALLIRAGWWHVSTQSTWIQDNHDLAEGAALFSSAAIMALTCVAYDALTFSDSTKWYEEAKDFDIENTQVSPDQVLPIFFSLWYFMEVTSHPYRFRASRAWLIFTALVLFFGQLYALISSSPGEELRQWISMFTLPGKCLFMANICIACFVSYVGEGNSRNRFKAERNLERTEKKTKHILDTLMPHLVLEELAKLGPGQEPQPHSYRHATIAQSDLCGFTKLSSEKRPDEVVSFMGELFGMFDELTDKYDVYKVETVGDAYIAGMAERPLTEKNIPVQVVLFALDMVRAVDKWAENLGVAVTCRCGIHYGECIGGVVGTGMQRYHLFGGLMAVLEVMESTAPEGRVQVSKACQMEVVRFMREDESAAQNTYDEIIGFEERTEPDLRTSKGEVHTYEEVHGRTYVVTSNQPLRLRST